MCSGPRDRRRQQSPGTSSSRRATLVLAFGGMALKNNDVGGGGTSQHIVRGSLRQAQERGGEFVLIGPLRDDLPDEARRKWYPIRPGTETR